MISAIIALLNNTHLSAYIVVINKNHTSVVVVVVVHVVQAENAVCDNSSTIKKNYTDKQVGRKSLHNVCYNSHSTRVSQMKTLNIFYLVIY